MEMDLENSNLSGIYKKNGLGWSGTPVEVVVEHAWFLQGFDAPHVVGAGEFLPVWDVLEGGIGGSDFGHDGLAIVAASEVVSMPAQGMKKLTTFGTLAV